jgi:hypothetical protein
MTINFTGGLSRNQQLALFSSSDKNNLDVLEKRLHMSAWVRG